MNGLGKLIRSLANSEVDRLVPKKIVNGAEGAFIYQRVGDNAFHLMKSAFLALDSAFI